MLLVMFFILLTSKLCLKPFGSLDIRLRKEYTNIWRRIRFTVRRLLTGPHFDGCSAT